MASSFRLFTRPPQTNPLYECANIPISPVADNFSICLSISNRFFEKVPLPILSYLPD